MSKLNRSTKRIAAQFVKPFVKSNENDRMNAEAICEAMGRPGIRFVATKTDRIVGLDEWIAQTVRKDPVSQRLMKLRGIGPLPASALSGGLGDGRAFSRGRDFAVSLGLTPRQHSTGGKDRQLGISKRGDTDLRKLLVHGARAVIHPASGREDELSQWIKALATRQHANVVAVALANKTARVAAWPGSARSQVDSGCMRPSYFAG